MLDVKGWVVGVGMGVFSGIGESKLGMVIVKGITGLWRLQFDEEELEDEELEDEEDEDEEVEDELNKSVVFSIIEDGEGLLGAGRVFDVFWDKEEAAEGDSDCWRIEEADGEVGGFSGVFSSTSACRRMEEAEGVVDGTVWALSGVNNANVIACRRIEGAAGEIGLAGARSLSGLVGFLCSAIAAEMV